MKTLKILILLSVMVLAPPLSSEVIILQGGFAIGTTRSDGASLIVEHSAGVPFTGFAEGGNLQIASGLYGFRLNELYPGIEEKRDDGHDMVNPRVTVMMPPYPNPGTNFSIRFYIPENDDVEIVIYNAAGAVVRTLQSGELNGGWHTLRWNGTDNASRRVSAGVYFCRLKTSKKILIKKLVLLVK